ncbi:hypothetical protein ACG95N_09710 [Acinetobacter guillouiae]|uniref:hypothetical protein n=1 Tax=Acinetobacter guillouiae TaxID=106649 RepID=UPI003AF9B376
MSYGLTIYNPDTGNIVIDNNYMNQGVIASGTIASLGSYTIPPYGGRLYKLTYPSFILNPSVAIQLDKTVRVSKTNLSNTSSGMTCYIWVSGDPGTLKYYLYGSSVVATSSYGLRVYDANGRVTYDSGMPYLKILGVAANNLTTWTVNGVPVTGAGTNSSTSEQFDSAKKLAIMITGDASDNVYASIPPGPTGTPQTIHNINIAAFYITSDNRVHQQRYQFSETLNDTMIDSTTRQGYASSFVLDVTNY